MWVDQQKGVVPSYRLILLLLLLMTMISTANAPQCPVESSVLVRDDDGKKEPDTTATASENINGGPQRRASRDVKVSSARRTGIPSPTPRKSSAASTTPGGSSVSSTPKAGSSGSKTLQNNMKDTPNTNSNKSTPSSKRVPVWERLYQHETQLTASMKAAARSGQRDNTVMSFSGGGAKKSTDRHRTSLGSLGGSSGVNTPIKSDGTSDDAAGGATPESIRSAVRAASRAGGTSTSGANGGAAGSGGGGGAAVHDRLYQAETYASARIKGPRFSSGSDNNSNNNARTGTGTPQSVRKSKAAKMPGKQDDEPIHERLNRLGTKASEGQKAVATTK